MSAPPIDGIVVGSVDLGESDRILRLLTASEGRISVIARKARGSQRRYANMLDLGTRLHVVRGHGKGQLLPITEAERLAGPDKARTDLDRIGHLAYGCELCAALAPEGHEASKLYGLLSTWLDLLEGAASPGPSSRIALEAKALTFAGVAPALLRCAQCGELLTDPAVFDFEAGGGVHARCGSGRAAPLSVLHGFELLRRKPLAETVELPFPFDDAIWLLSDFAQHHLGRALAARSWFVGIG